MTSTTAFEDKVHDYVDLEERIATITAEAKALKKKQSELGTSILSFMQNAGTTKCETTTLNLIVSESVGQASLSVPLLTRVFSDFFAGRPEIATKLLAAIALHRKQAVGQRVRLKKVKRRAAADES